MIELTKELQDELIAILKIVEKQDQPVRDKQIRLWKGLELYWKNIQDIFWDERVRDWRPISSTTDTNPEIDTYYADKVINIYRAHGESIIAALSQDLPQVIFIPDDAEKQEDLTTAKCWSLISELISKQNKSVLLLIRALYLLYNQGTIGAYIYSKPDEKNGTYQIPEYGKAKQYTDMYSCPICGSDLDTNIRMEEEQTINTQFCEYCEMEVIPITDTEEEEIPTITGYREEPKPRPCIEIYGMLNIRIPHYIREQKECGYLVLETESDKAYAQDIAGDDIEIGSYGNENSYDRWARVSSDFNWDDITNIVTWRRVWLRSWMFNHATTPELRDALKKQFPKGTYFLMMNEQFIECDNEGMDERWIISSNPLSSHIHAEPIGLPAKSVQEIRSEIVTLQLQSMEYGIPETWADPSIVDFPSYSKVDAAPGQVFPSKGMPAGRALQDAFFTNKTANFPKESEDFKKSIDQDGQFVLGDFPSIYGGVQQGGSKTFAEYSSSQARALQRLSIVWKVVSHFWAGITEKSVRTFINDIKEDEKFVKKSGGNWVNIWIRRAELGGKIGSVEPETNNSFPMSWAQKKDALLKLFEFQSEDIAAVMRHPENAGTISKYLGFPELYIPGEDDRNKQLNEITELLLMEPMEVAEGQLISSVPIDPEIDNHEIEFETCQAWLKSEYGQDAKMSNPGGYENVKAHAKEHYMIVAMQAQQEKEQEKEEGKDETIPKTTTT